MSTHQKIFIMGKTLKSYMDRMMWPVLVISHPRTGMMSPEVGWPRWPRGEYTCTRPCGCPVAEAGRVASTCMSLASNGDQCWPICHCFSKRVTACMVATELSGPPVLKGLAFIPPGTWKNRYLSGVWACLSCSQSLSQHHSLGLQSTWPSDRKCHTTHHLNTEAEMV